MVFWVCRIRPCVELFFIAIAISIGVWVVRVCPRAECTVELIIIGYPVSISIHVPERFLVFVAPVFERVDIGAVFILIVRVCAAFRFYSVCESITVIIIFADLSAIDIRGIADIEAAASAIHSVFALVLQVLFHYQQGYLYKRLPPAVNHVLVALYIAIAAYAFAYFLFEYDRIAIYSQGTYTRQDFIVGLLASVACGAAAPVDWNVYRWMIGREAQQFSGAFFDLLRNNEPHKAYQLTIQSRGRAPFDEKLWESYTNNAERYEELKSFVKIPAVRALLALGDKAEVRYYDTELQGYAQDDEVLKQVYAVTFPAAQGKKTFFARLTLRRGLLPRSRESYWRAEFVEGGVQPVALGGTLKLD